MNNTNGLPDDFSGIAEFQFINTDLIKGTETVDVYIQDYGHFLEKKGVHDKLQASLIQKITIKRAKI